ncbi:DNA primase [candidate division WOR-3 bacterium RBG_13_43_14]|uniref:DNA primase n=1 Tax=candidate division WOR-3 bacterium RBG_13_43_14 TaxID=1802590 RepID=A0A1F4UF63_UNCW3|nr:MAG: DNA primase [candidate division WOR-3 bacterium RBG_13_43_14]
MIEKEKIEEVKRLVDIVGVISQYVQLRKMGKNYRALCPFHHETEPSFYVSPEKRMFYCFGCKKSGNAISFLMEYEKLDFPAAVKKLAHSVGLEIDTSHGLKHKELYDTNESAAQYYSLCLTREVGKRGKQYLLERKTDINRLKEFHLGYAPTSGGLITYMRQKGISSDCLNKLGLISNGREVFRARIIFPIFNLSGRVIGFGGRGIDDNIKPKYLNSPESPIFKKGDVLYGLFQTRENIRQHNDAILVEGYFDLLSLYQHGFNYCAAPLGTSLTENQSSLIARYTKRVNILFDGDLSGIKAALRAIGLLINSQVDVFVTALPDEQDPDALIREGDEEKLRKAVKDAVDFFHFYRRMVKTDTVEQEVTLIKDLIQMISTIRDPIRQDRYIKYAAHVFDITEDKIKKEMRADEVEKPVIKKQRETKLTEGEQLIIWLISYREFVSLAREVLSSDDFEDKNLKKIYELLCKDDKISVDEIMEQSNEYVHERLIGPLMRNEPISQDGFTSALIRYKLRVEDRKQEVELARVKGNEEAEERVLRKHMELKRKLTNLSWDHVQAPQ